MFSVLVTWDIISSLQQKITEPAKSQGKKTQSEETKWTWELDSDMSKVLELSGKELNYS